MDRFYFITFVGLKAFSLQTLSGLRFHISQLCMLLIVFPFIIYTCFTINSVHCNLILYIFICIALPLNYFVHSYFHIIFLTCTVHHFHFTHFLQVLIPLKKTKYKHNLNGCKNALHKQKTSCRDSLLSRAAIDIL